MTFNISLNFNGNCKEAVNYYSAIFNGKATPFLTYGDLDTSFDPNVNMSERGKSLIANTQLNIHGTIVTFSDMPDNFEFVRGNNLALCVSFDSLAEAKSAFDSLSAGGMVFVPLTPENPSYSLLADKFEVTWNISVN